jgi:hypothetical protein
MPRLHRQLRLALQPLLDRAASLDSEARREFLDDLRGDSPSIVSLLEQLLSTELAVPARAA